MTEHVDELTTYAAWCLAKFGTDVDALAVAENAARPLTQDELDFVFEWIDGRSS